MVLVLIVAILSFAGLIALTAILNHREELAEIEARRAVDVANAQTRRASKVTHLDKVRE